MTLFCMKIYIPKFSITYNIDETSHANVCETCAQLSTPNAALHYQEHFLFRKDIISWFFNYKFLRQDKLPFAKRCLIYFAFYESIFKNQDWQLVL